MTEIAGSTSRPADRSAQVLETTIGGVLREAAERAAGAPALVDGTVGAGRRRRWTYDDLLADSERVARALLGRFAPGERVALCAPGSPEWLLVEFGAALAGLTLVIVDPALPQGALEDLLDRIQVRGIVVAGVPALACPTRAGLREVISLTGWEDFVRSGLPAEPLPVVGPGDAAQIQLTAGPVPRAVILGHRGITNSARVWMEILEGGPDDVFVNPVPLHSPAGGILLTLGAVQGRFAQVLPAGADAGLLLHLLEAERGTAFGGSPDVLLAQLGHPDRPGRDLGRVRCSIAIGVTQAAIIRRVESVLDVPVSAVYARTEASAAIAQTRLDDSPTDRAETLGRPPPGVEVRIADPRTGETMPAGALGELLTRGWHVMAGYADDPVATAAAIDGEGWLHTGDLRSMDERGYVTSA